MHVDGFRFDLASALAADFYAIGKLESFFDVIGQDPILSQVKIIAEPWHVGAGGYQVGNFPPGWAEWNGKYRDCVRKFWKGDGGTVNEMATRLSGSSDLYAHNGRKPSRASTLLPATTASPCATSSVITTSTTRPTARRAATASRTTSRGTAARRGRPRTRPSSRCAPSSSGTSWRR